MSDHSKSPNKFIGSIGRAVAGVGGAGGGKASIEELANRGGLVGRAISMAQARKARRQNVPSVVATAGASGMSGRIEGIESRLAALEGGGTTAGATQPAEVAPVESQPRSVAEIATAAAKSNAVNMPGVTMSGAMIGAVQPQTAASEELGSLMASPFTVRQRANMGPLNLNSPLNGNAFSKAVQDAKAAGESTFEVGGKTYNVK
jgi:hypothetical protein|tara:strand:- start:450 stop:1061 length:612 start_codon:yes stop_codon:yes gene_type:complete